MVEGREDVRSLRHLRGGGLVQLVAVLLDGERPPLLHLELNPERRAPGEYLHEVGDRGRRLAGDLEPERLELGKRHLRDLALAVGGAAHVAVVHYHELAVLCGADVRLEARYAVGDRLPERAARVVVELMAPAAMADYPRPLHAERCGDGKQSRKQEYLFHLMPFIMP